MNPEWFGDSFDIVKRFFVGVLKESGYQVFVDPMCTGNWHNLEKPFHAFIGAENLKGMKNCSGKKALLLDPDTGIGKKKTEKHTTMEHVSEMLKSYDIVFSFDQSFARVKKGERSNQVTEKLSLLPEKVFGFYYDSHARFLFAGKKKSEVNNVYDAIVVSGLPKSRLIWA